MRKAGFEIRLIADECGSWEENPPDLLNFIKRDLRWCQGNLQYARLIGRLAVDADGGVPARERHDDVLKLSLLGSAAARRTCHSRGGRCATGHGRASPFTC